MGTLYEALHAPKPGTLAFVNECLQQCLGEIFKDIDWHEVAGLSGDSRGRSFADHQLNESGLWEEKVYHPQFRLPLIVDELESIVSENRPDGIVSFPTQGLQSRE